MWPLLLACEPDPQPPIDPLEIEHLSGSLDPSFGEGGVVTLPPDPYRFTSLPQLALLPDDSALLVGDAYHPDDFDVHVPAALRVEAEGALDDTFAGGFRLPDFEAGFLRTPLVDDQGRVWLGASGTLSSRPVTGGFVLRFLPDGSADPSWGEDGFAGPVLQESTTGWSDAPLLALDDDGGVVLTVRVADDRVVALRFDPDGLVDPTFAGGAGELVIAAEPYVSVAAVSSSSEELFVTAAGQVLAFGWDGTGLREVGEAGAWVRDLVADDAGLWIATASDASSAPAHVERWSSDGTRDVAWGADGVWESSAPASEVWSLWAYDDGRLLVAGTRWSYDRTPTLWRVDETGATDPSFGAAGEVQLPGDYPPTAAALPDGRIVTVSTTGLKVYLARLLP